VDVADSHYAHFNKIRLSNRWLIIKNKENSSYDKIEF
jgi:hypothetical protein